MIKKLSVILITIIMLAAMASAYVPPEYRTGEQMSEYELIKVAMTAHDGGDNSKWVKYTLEDAAIHHTNSGRILNDYAQLREYLRKIESQGKPVVRATNPVNEAIWTDGVGQRRI